MDATASTLVEFLMEKCPSRFERYHLLRVLNVAGYRPERYGALWAHTKFLRSTGLDGASIRSTSSSGSSGSDGALGHFDVVGLVKCVDHMRPARLTLAPGAVAGVDDQGYVVDFVAKLATGAAAFASGDVV